MKTKSALKQIFVFVMALLSLLSVTAYAEFTPPCEANAYIARCNINGDIEVDYYSGSQYQCTETLSKNYSAGCPDDTGYTILTDSELVTVIEYTNELLKIGFYFAIAVTVAGVFISGIKVMNA